MTFLFACTQRPDDAQEPDDTKTELVDEINISNANTTPSQDNSDEADALLSTETTETDAPNTAIFDQYDFATVDETTPQQDAETAQSDDPFCLGITQPQPITVAQACERISTRLASVSLDDCKTSKLELSQCLSANKFPILMRKFPPLEDKPVQGRILVIGGTHGDELTSVSIVFRWIQKLNKHHSGLFHWHFAPMMNPDGVLKSAASRTNFNGVDLNRNMPTDDWNRNALEYWERKTGSNPRRYPGEVAASEPETQWLIDEINEFKPDAIISVHAPYGVVDFDALVLNTAPKSLGRLRLNLLGTFPGSLGNYAGINRNIPVITLELPHAWYMPSEKETTKIWEDIVGWLKINIGKNEKPQ